MKDERIMSPEDASAAELSADARQKIEKLAADCAKGTVKYADVWAALTDIRRGAIESYESYAEELCCVVESCRKVVELIGDEYNPKDPGTLYIHIRRHNPKGAYKLLDSVDKLRDRLDWCIFFLADPGSAEDEQ